MPVWTKYLLGLAMIVVGVVLNPFVPRPILTCDRGETGNGTCTLVTLVFYLPQERTFRVADLREARLSQVSSPGARLRYAVTLRLAYTEYPLPRERNAGESQRAMADQINAYIGDPSQRMLQVGRQSHPLMRGFMVICAVAGCALIGVTWKARSGRQALPATEAAAPASDLPSPPNPKDDGSRRPRRSRSQVRRQRATPRRR